MQLLVSVRSSQEAEAAVRGGAALVDVKEPLHGSLGRASSQTIAEVIRQVAGRTPVSAALGELTDYAVPPVPKGLSYVKWGLAGCRNQPWQRRLVDVGRQARQQVQGLQTVAVAYVDWEPARAPYIKDVLDFARANGWTVLLLDTYVKDGKSLLDWLPIDLLWQFRLHCQKAGIKLALAGSLTLELIARLRDISPDWFAVRRAACRMSLREASVEEEAVRRLVMALEVPAPSGESLRLERELLA